MTLDGDTPFREVSDGHSRCVLSQSRVKRSPATATVAKHLVASPCFVCLCFLPSFCFAKSGFPWCVVFPWARTLVFIFQWKHAFRRPADTSWPQYRGLGWLLPLATLLPGLDVLQSQHTVRVVSPYVLSARDYLNPHFARVRACVPACSPCRICPSILVAELERFVRVRALLHRVFGTFSLPPPN